MKETYSTTKQLLISAEVPASTKSYKAVPHQQVIDCTLEALDKAGLILSSERYSSSKEGQIATGRYVIKSVADDEMQLQIAWLNSYNKTKRLTYGVGAEVRICMNGMISADMGFFKKKHQGGIQEFTPIAIVEYVKQAEEVFKRLQDEREKMKEVQLTKRVIAELIGRAVMEEEFITTTQLNIIKREMEHPTHDYGAPNSMWELYNFCSYAVKELHPSLWMKSHLKMHSFFTHESGIIVPEKVLALANGEEEVAPNQINMYEVPGFVESSDPIDVNAEVAEIFEEIPDVDASVAHDLEIIEERLDIPSQEETALQPSPEIEKEHDEYIITPTGYITPEPSVGIEIDTPQDNVDEETGEIFGPKTTDYSDLM